MTDSDKDVPLDTAPFERLLSALGAQHAHLRVEAEQLLEENRRLRSVTSHSVDEQVSLLNSSPRVCEEGASWTLGNDSRLELKQRIPDEKVVKVSGRRLSHALETTKPVENGEPMPVGLTLSQASTTVVSEPRQSFTALMPAEFGSPIIASSIAPIQSEKNKHISIDRRNSRFTLVAQWDNNKRGTFGGISTSVKDAIYTRREDSGLSRCVMSSTGRPRLCWEAFWSLGLAYEMWFIPFEIVFLAEAPEAIFVSMNAFVLGIFVFDILLNFFTGYPEGNTEIFQHHRIAIHYFRTWFVCDIIATIPWDEIMASDVSVLSTARSAKASKGIKALKVIKLLRVAKSVRLLTNSRRLLAEQAVERCRKGHHHSRRGGYITLVLKKIKHTLEAQSNWILRIVKAVLLLVLLSHTQCIVWALLQEGAVSAENTQVALRNYLACFRVVFAMLTLGSWPDASTPAQWLFEMVMLVERVFLIMFCFVLTTMYHALTVYAEGGEDDLRRQHAMKYLRSRDVSGNLQIQLLQDAKEANTMRKMYKEFEDLMVVEANTELRRMIHVELWSNRLATLGLILEPSVQNVDFITELAQRVTEETFAANSIIFQEGTAALRAYQVIEGTLIVVGSPDKADEIPPFTKDMWIGEKALVSPQLRRSRTVATKEVTSLMVVNHSDFVEVLEQFDLAEDFELFCTRNLWKGLCGRCGRVGDHFGHECWKLESPKGLIDCTPEADRKMKELHMFLLRHDMGDVIEEITQAGITTLEDLRNPNLMTGDGKANDTCKEIREKLESLERSMQMGMGKMFCRTKAEQHFVFLSHYKVEAGTEAALMRTELEHLIKESEGHPAQRLTASIFLDSEDLTDLSALVKAVKMSHNICLLLTRDVLKRPWCLVEVVTAFQMGIPVLLVQIEKPGTEFTYPDEAFFKSLLDGTLLGESGASVLEQQGFSIDVTHAALRSVFQRIALPYTPHRSVTFRMEQVRAIMRQCKIRAVELDSSLDERSSTIGARGAMMSGDHLPAPAGFR